MSHLRFVAVVVASAAWTCLQACSTSSGGPPSTCGVTAEQIDAARTCTVGNATLASQCEQNPGSQAKSDQLVCTVDPQGTMYVFYIPSNWALVETAGWSYGRQGTSGVAVSSTTAPLSAGDLAACTALVSMYGIRSQAIPACGANDAGADG